MKTQRITICCIIALLAAYHVAHSRDQSFILRSPDGSLRVNISIANEIKWNLLHRNDTVLDWSTISLAIDGGKTLGNNPRLRDYDTRSVNRTIPSPLYKKSEVVDHFNELTLQFRNNFSLIFRAYNDGVAYRFATSIRGEIKVAWEECNLNLADNHMILAPYLESREQDVYASSFESLYQNIRIADFDESQLSYTPIIVDLGNGKKAAIMEVDLEDYPGLFLKLNAVSYTHLTLPTKRIV